MAGVKYDAHYNITSVDPPELVHFIKKSIQMWQWKSREIKTGDKITMWNLIPKKKMPPTRTVRYCCDKLKEGGGEGRFVVTGVRWAESARRANSRAGLELSNGTKTGYRDRVDPDNPDNEKMARFCPTKGKQHLEPHYRLGGRRRMGIYTQIRRAVLQPLRPRAHSLRVYRMPTDFVSNASGGVRAISGI